MDIVSGLLLALLLYGGGFTHGYISKEDKVCKNISFQIPDTYSKDSFRVKDCIETSKISCDDKISKPRYVVPKDSYLGLRTYVKESKLYMESCNSVIQEYNKDKYAE